MWPQLSKCRFHLWLKVLLWGTTGTWVLEKTSDNANMGMWGIGCVCGVYLEPKDDGQQGSESGKCFVGPAWGPWNLLTGLSTVQFPFMQLWATIPQKELEVHDAENFRRRYLCVTMPCWSGRPFINEWNVQKNALQETVSSHQIL